MLDFVVSGQELKRVDSKMIVSDTIDYITARFRFSGDWAGLTKHALFEKGTDTYDITLTDNAITESDSCNLTDGTWLLSVVGVEIVDAVVTQRITTQQIELSVTASGNTSGEPFPPSSGSDVYTTLNQETPQTFIGGVPKLAADRVIIDDHHITDKKFVEDYVDGSHQDHNDLNGLQGGDAGEYYHMTQEQSIVLGNTSGENTGDQSASDFDHDGLAGLQGGSESEHYHMTEAEHAALHAHSNKTALDAVSGTNTGDQDVSGAIYTHNTAADAHAILARKSETMRLLISRTIGAGEDVSAISWTQDDAGNELALIDAEIRCSIPSPISGLADGSNLNIYGRLNNVSTNYYFGGSVFECAVTRNRGGASNCLIKKIGATKYSICTSSAGTDSLSSSVTVVRANGNPNIGSVVNKIYAYANATGVTYFPEGMVFEIYGRTA